MQVYSQTSTSTTLPRSAAAVSGAEFTQRSTLKTGTLAVAPTRHEPATTPKNRSGRMVFIDESLHVHQLVAGTSGVAASADARTLRAGRLMTRYRSCLNAARTSDANSAGSSHAAKCPPRSTSLK